MVIEMKEYFVFKIKNEIFKLYRNRPGDLFDVLNRIYYMKTIDLEYGKNLFNQVACFLSSKCSYNAQKVRVILSQLYLSFSLRR